MGGLMTPVMELASQSITFYFAICFISFDLFPFHKVKVIKQQHCYIFFVSHIISLIEN